MRLPSTSRTWPASKGSIIPWAAAIRRIHLSLLMLIAFSVVLDDDLGEYRRAVLRLARDARGHLARDVAVDGGDRALGVRNHAGLAGIGLLADADVERQRAEEFHVVVLAHLLAAAGAEDVLGVPALRADVDRHVLDDADDRDADLLEHLEALPRIDEGDVLGRGDDHGAGDRHLLREGELDVAGAGRQVDHEVV